MRQRVEKGQRGSKRSVLPSLRVAVDAPTHRLLKAENASVEEGLALLKQRMRERFVATLALGGLKVPPSQVQIATYELSAEQRAMQIERLAKYRTPGFQGASPNDHRGWVHVPYLLVGTDFFVHGRNMNGLDERQLEHFLHSHMGPMLSGLPRGSKITVVHVEPKMLDKLAEEVA